MLSGFLITTLLLIDLDSGRFTFGGFYARRLGRLMPSLLLVLAAVVVFSMVMDQRVEEHVKGAISSLFYYSNWRTGSGTEMAGLGHVWTLAIEEQFYLIWPVVLAFAFARKGWKTVLRVALVGFALSVAIRTIVLVSMDDWFFRVHYATDTRAAALLIGCAAGAVLFRDKGEAPSWMPPPPVINVAPVAIVPALVFAELHDRSTWIIGVPVYEIVLPVILLDLVTRRSALSRLLSFRPLVYVGTISYGLYLWHLVVIWAAGRNLDGPTRMAVQLVVPFVLAALSYHLIESPIRDWVRRRLRAREMAARTGG